MCLLWNYFQDTSTCSPCVPPLFSGNQTDSLRHSSSRHDNAAASVSRPSPEPCHYHSQSHSRKQTVASPAVTKKDKGQADPLPKDAVLGAVPSVKQNTEKESVYLQGSTSSKPSVAHHSQSSLDTERTYPSGSQTHLPSPNVHDTHHRNEVSPKPDETTSQLKGDATSRITRAALLGAELEGLQADCVYSEHVALHSKPKPVKPDALCLEDSNPLQSSKSSQVAVQDVASEIASPTTGVYFSPSSNKKRKNVSKGKATHQLSEPIPSPAIPLSLPIRRDCKSDCLLRKESESSLKSADSESSCSTSKSDDKEYAEATLASLEHTDAASTKSEASPDVDIPESPLQSRSLHIPFGKEPNTGQSMPVSGELEAISVEDVLKKEHVKVKNKKKQRQLRKEEKMRRRDRERASRIRDKPPNMSVEEPLSPSFEHSEGDYLNTDEASSMKSSSSQQTLAASNSAPKLVEEETSVTDREVMGELDHPSEVSASSSPPSHQPLPTSVPSDTGKSLHGRQENKTQFKDIMLDPFSRNPDRSTYASKKVGSRKSSLERAGRPLEEDLEEASLTPGKRASVGVVQVNSMGKAERTEWPSLGMSYEMVDGVIDSSAAATATLKDQLQVMPTPHDLAASVLSKIPMKMKKACVSPTKNAYSSDCEDEDQMVREPHALKFGENLTKSESSTPFPPKDGFLSSPSPPLPTNGQQQKHSTLSRDAQPFYPSSNPSKHLKSSYKEKLHPRSREGEMVSRQMECVGSEVKARRLASERTDKNMASLPRNDTQHAVSPADRAVINRAEYFNQCTEKSSSPPFGASYGPDPQAYGFSEPRFETRQMAILRRRLPESDRRAFFSSADESAMLQCSDGLQHDQTAVDPFLKGKNFRHRLVPNRLPSNTFYQTHPKPEQLQAPGHLPPPPSYEESAMHAHPLLEEDFKRQQIELHKHKFLLDLYREKRASRAAEYARHQALRSAEALNSLHFPPSHMSGYSSEPNKQLLADNLLEDLLVSVPGPPFSPPHRGLDTDHSMLGPYSLLPDVTSPLVPFKAGLRGSGMEEDGTSLPSFHRTGQQLPASATLPAYKRAPGAEFSLLQESGLDNPLAEQQRSNLHWSPDAAGVSVGHVHICLCTACARTHARTKEKNVGVTIVHVRNILCV